MCGPRVRTITACQGSVVCPSGNIDSYDIAKKLDERYFARELPHKFKFGVTGCQHFLNFFYIVKFDKWDFHTLTGSQMYVSVSVFDDMIRISVGIEDIEDLKQDFTAAIQNTAG